MMNTMECNTKEDIGPLFIVTPKPPPREVVIDPVRL
ncbi:hypothetical protein NGUA38_00162 [Salmonella enterica]|nr:hypothetical protein NGUA38_00162 [Salmonella enterica]